MAKRKIILRPMAGLLQALIPTGMPEYQAKPKTSTKNDKSKKSHVDV